MEAMIESYIRGLDFFQLPVTGIYGFGVGYTLGRQDFGEV
jgi:hypothetical protein